MTSRACACLVALLILCSGCGQSGSDIANPATSSPGSLAPPASEVGKSPEQSNPGVTSSPGQPSGEASSVSPSPGESEKKSGSGSKAPLVGPGPSLFQEGIVKPETHALVLDAQTTGPISFPLSKPTSGDVLYAMTCSAPTTVAVTRFPAGQPMPLDDGGQCVPGRVFHAAVKLPETTTRLDVVMSPESVVHVSVFAKQG